MLLSLDARRGRLLTNSRYTQTSGAELDQIKVAHSMRVHPSDSFSAQSGKSPLHRSSPAGSSRAGPLCKSHRQISERPVTPRVESTKPHSLSEPRPLCGKAEDRIKNHETKTHALASGGLILFSLAFGCLFLEFYSFFYYLILFVFWFSNNCYQRHPGALRDRRYKISDRRLFIRRCSLHRGCPRRRRVEDHRTTSHGRPATTTVEALCHPSKSLCSGRLGSYFQRSLARRSMADWSFDRRSRGFRLDPLAARAEALAPMPNQAMQPTAGRCETPLEIAEPEVLSEVGSVDGASRNFRDVEACTSRSRCMPASPPYQSRPLKRKLLCIGATLSIERFSSRIETQDCSATTLAKEERSLWEVYDSEIEPWRRGRIVLDYHRLFSISFSMPCPS